VSAARTSATVEAQVIDGYHAKVRVRQFEAEVDEPPVVGGTDIGPMPTEYLLMGLASCFALAVAHVARRDGVEVGPVRVSVVATYDGLSFSSVTVTVHLEETSGIDTDALLQKARRVCYVSNTLARRPEIVTRLEPA
jgi:organic hydroperoxide reductase OsmC/OhrA